MKSSAAKPVASKTFANPKTFAKPQNFAAPTALEPPKILVFDSGLGGLTVFAELVKARADASFVYAADDAGFPYGPRSENDLAQRVEQVMDALIAEHQPDCVVIACNTASTLVLPRLRARFAVPFIGTVPAVKPAAALSHTRIIAVLATPGTVARDYTQGLIRQFAGDCKVVLVGAKALAGQAEAFLRGQAVDDAVIAAEIAPCFIEAKGLKTDVVALSCTHYPLLLPHMQRLSPWSVTFIDPAAAIARRAAHMLEVWPVRERETHAPAARAIFTGGADVTDELRLALAQRGLDVVECWGGEG